jgi:hypothetical protein
MFGTKKKAARIKLKGIFQGFFMDSHERKDEGRMLWLFHQRRYEGIL